MKKIVTALAFVAACTGALAQEKKQKETPRSVMQLFQETLPELRMMWPEPVRRRGDSLVYFIEGRERYRKVVLEVAGPDLNKDWTLDENEVSRIRLSIDENDKEGRNIKETTILKKWRDGAWNIDHRTIVHNLDAPPDIRKDIEPVSIFIKKDDGTSGALLEFSGFMPPYMMGNAPASEPTRVNKTNAQTNSL